MSTNNNSTLTALTGQALSRRRFIQTLLASAVAFQIPTITPASPARLAAIEAGLEPLRQHITQLTEFYAKFLDLARLPANDPDEIARFYEEFAQALENSEDLINFTDFEPAVVWTLAGGEDSYTAALNRLYPPGYVQCEAWFDEGETCNNRAEVTLTITATDGQPGPVINFCEPCKGRWLAKHKAAGYEPVLTERRLVGGE